MSSFSIRKDIRSDTLNSREIYRRTVTIADANPAGFISGTNELVEIIAPSTGAMKIDVTPLEDISIEFAKLKPSRYTIVHQGDEVKNDIGLIAEDVLLSFPEFVQYGAFSTGCGSSSDKNSVKGLQYDKLVVLCIQQIQQLKEQNAILAGKVAALERR